MRIRIPTKLNCSPLIAWNAVIQSEMLQYVSKPLLTFRPTTPHELPLVWGESDYAVKVKLFGIFPLGTQIISVSFPKIDTTSGKREFQLRDSGRNRLFSKWDHIITIKEATSGLTRYSDRIEFRAGLLTPIIWLFLNFFFRHRQLKWRKLANSRRRLKDPEGEIPLMSADKIPVVQKTKLES